MKKIIIIGLLMSVLFVAGCISGIGNEETCTPNIQCSSWSECNSSGMQTRTCNDLNNCKVPTIKPILTQNCTPEQFSCEKNDDCLATCAFGCVNKIWMDDRPECLLPIEFECRCIDNTCQNISKEQSCIESGGQVTTGRCGFDFPNTCAVGDCAACFPDPNAPECKNVKICDCGDIDEMCFNGIRCVQNLH